MSRTGQVWESKNEGLFIALWEEKLDGFDIVAFLKVSTGGIAFLPTYVILASEMRAGDEDLTWNRVA